VFADTTRRQAEDSQITYLIEAQLRSTTTSYKSLYHATPLALYAPPSMTRKYRNDAHAIASPLTRSYATHVDTNVVTPRACGDLRLEAAHECLRRSI